MDLLEKVNRIYEGHECPERSGRTPLGVLSSFLSAETRDKPGQEECQMSAMADLEDAETPATKVRRI